MKLGLVNVELWEGRSGMGRRPFAGDITNPTTAVGRVLVGGVGRVFDCRLVVRSDIGRTATTSRMGSAMLDVDIYAFVLVNCLSDPAISGVNVSSATATGGVNRGVARVRAVDGRGGFAGARAVDVPHTTTATGMHVALVSNCILPNDLLLSGIDYRFVGIARGRTEVSRTTAASGVELIGVNNAFSASGGREIVGARVGLRITRERGVANVTNPSTTS
jgi:hypothetical protein